MTDLTQEEKKRIYREEKARLEAQEQIRTEFADHPPPPPSIKDAYSIFDPSDIMAAEPREAPRNKFRRLAAWGIIIFAPIFVWAMIRISEDTATQPHASVAYTHKAMKASTTQYTIFSVDDCTVDSDQPCTRTKIIVPIGQSKAQIAADLFDASTQNPTLRGVVFAYAKGTNIKSEYSAARAIWGPSQIDGSCTAGSPKIDYISDYFRAISAVRTISKRKAFDGKFAHSTAATLSESERQKIYYEDGQAEANADDEASASYPVNSPASAVLNAKMTVQLEEKYQNRLRRKYHLTDGEFSGILAEGGEKGWPSPS